MLFILPYSKASIYPSILGFSYLTHTHSHPHETPTLPQDLLFSKYTPILNLKALQNLPSNN